MKMIPSQHIAWKVSGEKGEKKKNLELHFSFNPLPPPLPKWCLIMKCIDQVLHFEVALRYS